MYIAKLISPTLLPYITALPPSATVRLTGHSIGGSLSILLLILWRGEEGVVDKIERVYAYGPPPVVRLGSDGYDDEYGMDTGISNGDLVNNNSSSNDDDGDDDVWEDAMSSLSSSDIRQLEEKVWIFLQPWDPVPRLFTRFDPCYPLVGDIGLDGLTLYSSGPSRILRPIVRSILSLSPQKWAALRDNYLATETSDLRHFGLCHLLLPTPGMYLSSLLLTPSTLTPPPTTQIYRVNDSREVLELLDSHFPLDEFRISLVPQAVRSFVHHFHPAYKEEVGRFFRPKNRNRKGSKKANDKSVR